MGCEQGATVTDLRSDKLLEAVKCPGAATIGFPAWVWLDGQEHPCQLQADFAGQERILGRDVLNRMDVLFRGPGGEVVLNP